MGGRYFHHWSIPTLPWLLRRAPFSHFHRRDAPAGPVEQTSLKVMVPKMEGLWPHGKGCGILYFEHFSKGSEGMWNPASLDILLSISAHWGFSWQPLRNHLTSTTLQCFISQCLNSCLGYPCLNPNPVSRGAGALTALCFANLAGQKASTVFHWEAGLFSILLI